MKVNFKSLTLNNKAQPTNLLPPSQELPTTFSHHTNPKNQETTFWNLIRETIQEKTLEDHFTIPKKKFLKRGHILPQDIFSQEDCITTLQKMAEKQIPEYSLDCRVYLNDGSGRYKEVAEILKDPPKKGSNLEEYLEKKMKGKKYFLVCNSFFKYYSAPVGRLATLYQALKHRLQQLEMLDDTKILTLSSSILIGNYDYTPIGVHHDNDFIRGGFHFQVSGSKTAYFWNEDEYIKHTGTKRRYFEPQKLIDASSDVYTTEQINANDFFHIAQPQHKSKKGPYHIFKNNDHFSIGFGIGYAIRDAKVLQNKALTQYIKYCENTNIDNTEFKELQTNAINWYKRQLDNNNGFEDYDY